MTQSSAPASKLKMPEPSPIGPSIELTLIHGIGPIAQNTYFPLPKAQLASIHIDADGRLTNSTMFENSASPPVEIAGPDRSRQTAAVATSASRAEDIIAQRVGIDFRRTALPPTSWYRLAFSTSVCLSFQRRRAFFASSPPILGLKARGRLFARLSGIFGNLVTAPKTAGCEQAAFLEQQRQVRRTRLRFESYHRCAQACCQKNAESAGGKDSKYETQDWSRSICGNPAYRWLSGCGTMHQ